MSLHTIEEQVVRLTPTKTNGTILDIGGGGEGVIGKLDGRHVVAIDLSAQELLEVKNDSQRIVMDARGLGFSSATFTAATAFFSLMYIKNTNHERVFREVHRVLKDGGRFLVWDVRIPERVVDAAFFVVPLRIILPDVEVKTSYGIKWDSSVEQDLEHFKELARESGFRCVDSHTEKEVFHLELIKTPEE